MLSRLARSDLDHARAATGGGGSMASSTASIEPDSSARASRSLLRKTPLSLHPLLARNGDDGDGGHRIAKMEVTFYGVSDADGRIRGGTSGVAASDGSTLSRKAWNKSREK